jgi:C4-dicarboxylate-binding protein DctP
MCWSLKRFVLAVGLLVVCPLCVCAAPKTKIRAVVPLAQESWLFQGLRRFKKTVEKSSNGDIEITLIPSSPLFEGHDIRSAVQSGSVEMGAVLLSEFGADIPATNIFAQPFMFFSEPMMKAAVASQSAVRSPIDQAILQSNNVRVLWWQSAGTTVVISKDEAVLTPSDFAGKKVVVSLPALAEMVKLCGATPVEESSGPEGGAITLAKADMSIVPIANVVDRKLWTVMNTLTVTRHIAQQFAVVINERVWGTLTDDQMRTVREAAAEAERYMYEDIRQDELENIELAAKNGMKVAEITATQAALWKSCASPMLESFLQQSGVLGQKVMDGYRQILVDMYRQPRK